MGMAVESHEFHVLAVDDSHIDRKLIERLLKTSSYQVTTVDSGSKALEFLGLQEDELSRPNQPSVSPSSQQDVQVNLIITDYCMPGMTGYDLLKKIKESSSLRDIPVVIMSSDNVPSRISRNQSARGNGLMGILSFRCLEEGAEEFFLKPVRMSDVNKLRPHMLKAKYRSQDREKQEDQEQITESQDEGGDKKHPRRLQQLQLQKPNNNKRKSMDEGLSPDRTRPRYNGLTVL